MSAAVGGKIDERTHYEVLGVSEDATTEEIRAAWRPLINGIHPDRETDPDAKAEADRKAALINAAYNTLKDPSQRKKYDNDLAGERGEQPASDGTNGQDRTAGPSDAQTHDDDEAAAWERIYREAQAEAEEAWARWENPSRADRFSEGIAEIGQWGFSKFSVMAPYDDYLQSRWDMDAVRPQGSLLLNTAMVTAVMAGLTVGQLLFRAGILVGGGIILTAMALTFLADLVFTVMGARPMRFITAKAGSAGALSEGDKLAAIATLAMRAVWAGVAGFFVATIAFLFVRWIYQLFAGASVLEVVAGYALVALPLVWTVVAVARWVAGHFASTSGPRDEHTEG